MPLSFRPPWWLRNGHVQTLFAALPARRDGGEALRLRLPSGEGLHMIARWQPGLHPRPAALLVHGVGGSTDSPYMIRAERAIVAAGFHAVSLDTRGSGEGATLARSVHHAGLTDDLDRAIARVLLDARVASVLVVGFSLGGQLALLLASRWGARPPAGVAGVVAVCPPLDLDATSRLIERPRSRLYLRYILRSLVAGATAVQRRDPGAFPVSPEAIRSARTIREFDERVIAPMHGFQGAEHYYAESSCGPRLGAIATPTLLLASADDPLIPASTLEPWLPGRSARVELHLTPHGGHLGHVDASPGRPWYLRRIIDRLRLAAGS